MTIYDAGPLAAGPLCGLLRGRGSEVVGAGWGIGPAGMALELLRKSLDLLRGKSEKSSCP